MRVSRYTDYSLRVLIYLGLSGSDRSTIRSISDAYGISRNHLMKVVQRLVAEGYVDSARGVGGGLTLARAATSVRIGDVVRGMEPDLGLVECMRPDNQCIITPACALRDMLYQARDGFINTLNQYTLADVLSAGRKEPLADLLRLEVADEPA